MRFAEVYNFALLGESLSNLFYENEIQSVRIRGKTPDVVRRCRTLGSAPKDGRNPSQAARRESGEALEEDSTLPPRGYSRSGGPVPMSTPPRTLSADPRPEWEVVRTARNPKGENRRSVDPHRQCLAILELVSAREPL